MFWKFVTARWSIKKSMFSLECYHVSKKLRAKRVYIVKDRFISAPNH